MTTQLPDNVRAAMERVNDCVMSGGYRRSINEADWQAIRDYLVRVTGQPTEEMLQAGWEVEQFPDANVSWRMTCAKVYAAMLAAAAREG